MIKQVDT